MSGGVEHGFVCLFCLEYRLFTLDVLLVFHVFSPS